MLYPFVVPRLGAVAFVEVKMKYPALVSFGAKLVLYVISTVLAGTVVAIVSFVCAFATFNVVSVLFTISIPLYPTS